MVRVVRSGTVVAASGFSAERDAEALRKAMKGLGCDAAAVSGLLCRRSNDQRQAVRSAYGRLFGRELLKDLSKELRGHHEDVCVALCLTPSQFDAVEMRRAVKGAGTHEDILIEILVTRSNAQLAALKTDYGAMFKRDLVKDVESDTSFHFRKLMRQRDESGRVDRQRAAADAKALKAAGADRWGTDESRFNAVMASQGFPQLQLLIQEYGKISRKTLQDAIRSEFSGAIRDGLLAIAKAAQHTPSFLAERLQLAMKGLGTKDKTLVRLIVSRSEVDLVQVKEAFFRLFGQSLERWVRGDTSGKYRDALLLLVQGNRSV